VSATSARLMFAIAPAAGRPALSAAEKHLLVGKAKWIHAAAANGLPTRAAVVITRKGWAGLLDESGGPRPLRAAWVAVLLKMVPAGNSPPRLVVRTVSNKPRAGLMAARLDIPPPLDPASAVDAARPLARAISAAFASYDDVEAVWMDDNENARRDTDIVLIQAQAQGQLIHVLTRDARTGEMGPAPLLSHLQLPQQVIDAGRPMAQLIDAAAGQHMTMLLERHRDLLIMVSARPVQASATAMLEAMRDRVERGSWSPREAIRRIDAAQLPQLLHPRLAEGADAVPVATGTGVSPGAASGEIVFSADDAARCRARGRHCILVVMETGPADIEGMRAATGILAARGGVTSHAAVIARITGKPCVAGVRSLLIDAEEGTCRLGGAAFRAGQRITIEGSTGQIFAAALPLERPPIGGAVSKLLDWADGARTIGVRTNVETVDAARTALSFGAEGIGLARSEHMFFSADRLMALRRLILSQSATDRDAALKGLVDFQTGDYAALFSLMGDKPVTVRLFDPPLHEFLPRTPEEIDETAAALGLTAFAMGGRLERLEEINPMLGHRGCRLAISHPEILKMQVHALVAGLRAAKKHGAVPATIEIMAPFVSSAREVAWLRTHLMAHLDGAGLSGADRAMFLFGTMIELPRAALRAGEIAPLVDFFSFGTNDLTQTTFGISRDDSPAFLASYRQKQIFSDDPFVTIDAQGVGELIEIAIARGKAANPDLKIGICGEHAGEPKSLRFLAGLDIDYVSCSPYRVPVARLVLAQAALD
jgi:pyruvate, orthophosphate dikinase